MEEKKLPRVSATHMSSYQHISNGGISFTFFTDVLPDGREYPQLEIMHSNHGVNHRSIVPVFVTTAPILRALADAIEHAGVQEFEYLRGITVEIQTHNGTSKFYRNVNNKAVEVSEEEIYGSGEGGNSEQAG